MNPQRNSEIWELIDCHMCFPDGSDGKESACNARDLGLIPRLGRCPAEGNGNQLLVFLPGEVHGQRSLADYSPWGHRVRRNWATNSLDTTEWLTLSLSDHHIRGEVGERGHWWENRRTLGKINGPLENSWETWHFMTLCLGAHLSPPRREN